ncbi:hypothetical protein AB0I95_15090 [Micromonospora sp. NPDC049751]|uniref:hypothetical protein n=1 Tax=Micromonospora sp. NPDC049751 TaxID=3154837 RepID=UPI0033CD2338
MSTVIVNLAEASDYKREAYGITHKGEHVYHVTGAGLHSRSHPHRVVVWDNTGRRNFYPDRWNECSGKPGPGAWLDPNGKGTDSEVTVILDAESIVITNNGTNTGTPASGQVYAPRPHLAIGDIVIMVYPDGTPSAPYVVEARPLRDPELVPLKLP